MTPRQTLLQITIAMVVLAASGHGIEAAQGDPSGPPPCGFSDGTIPIPPGLLPPAALRPGLTLKTTVVSPPNGTLRLKPDELETFFHDLRTANLVPKSKGHYVPLPYDQVRNDCEDRAEVAVAFLEATHPRTVVGKVFVSGQLSVFCNSIKWGYHVAPFTLSPPDSSHPEGQLLVIDPAIDNKPLPLPQWIQSITSDAPNGSTANVFLTAPGAWNFVKNAPTAPATTQSAFCSDVEHARTNLTDFLVHREHWTSLPNVAVDKVFDSCVTFKDPSGKDHGPFGASADVQARLSDLKGSSLLVCRQREYSNGALANAWHYLSHDIEKVYYVEPFVSKHKCPSPKDATQQQPAGSK